jgi:hypothetical protein
MAKIAEQVCVSRSALYRNRAHASPAYSGRLFWRSW